MQPWHLVTARRGAARTGLLLTLLAAGLALLGGASRSGASDGTALTVDYVRGPSETVAPRVINLREMIARYGTTIGVPDQRSHPIPLGRLPGYEPGDAPAPTTAAAPRGGTRPDPRVAVASSFDGLLNQPGFPPDGGLAVGPNHIISAGNSAFSVLNKLGTRLVTTQYAAFFASVDNTGFVFDPRADYDPLTNRWYMVILGLNGSANVSRLDIAVSTSGDPLGTYFVYGFDSSENGATEWMDYPTLGYTSQAFFIGGNTFSFPLATASFRGASMRIFDKQRMLNGQPVTPTSLLRFNAANGGAATVQPATVFDANITTQFMLDVRNGALGLFRVTNALATTPTINVTFPPAPSISNPPLMPQSGNPLLLDGGDTRMANLVQRGGQIWGCSGIDQSGRGAIRVYRLNPAGAGSLQSVFTLTDPTLGLHYPSLDLDGQGNVVVGYSCASPTINVSPGFSFKPVADANFGPAAIITPGTSGYNPGFGERRWGDYSDTQLDPSNPALVWTQHEMAAATSAWRLRVASIRTVDETITVLAPNGGEAFSPGDNFEIRWQAAGFAMPGNVRIELSTDGGVSFPISIAANTPNDGSFFWTVNNAPTTTGRVRITHLTQPAAFDVSNANFAIVDGLLEVIAPNGGESFTIGRAFEIRWFADGFAATAPNVRIELSRDGGNTFVNLFATTPNDGSQMVTVTGTPTDQALIRITTVSMFSFTDDSDDFFHLNESASITVVSPNGGELLPIGETGQEIRWNSSGFTTNVNIGLSRDGGVTYTPLINNTANDGVEPVVWPGPEVTVARIRIISVADPTVLDTSDSTFNLVNPTIAVTSPAAGQTLLGGGLTTVRWDTKGVDASKTVAIHLSQDGGNTFPTALVTNTPNDGVQDVALPTGDVPNAVIRVVKEANTVIRGNSGVFRITGPTLQIISPNGGETLLTGGQFTVTWGGSVLGNGTVTILLSTDGGRRFTQIVRGTPNDGGETLPVGTRTTRTGRIRIIFDPNPAVLTTSARNFTIARPRGRR